MKITGLVIFNCYFHGEQYENYIEYCFVIHTKIPFKKLIKSLLSFLNNDFFERIIFSRRERGNIFRHRADAQAPN